MTKNCCICGKPFEARKKSQITCLDPICRKIRYQQKQNEYDKTISSIHGVDKRTYKREKMREYRARERGEVYVPCFAKRDIAKPKAEVSAENYAERQKQKYLALAGKVQI